MIPCGVCAGRIGPGDRICPGCRRPLDERDRAALRDRAGDGGPPSVQPTPVVLVIAFGLIAGVGMFLKLRHERRHPPAWHPVVLNGEMVETGRRQISHAAIDAVSFRTHEEGWVTDARGHAFHTTDGGLTFEQLAANEETLAFNGRPPDDDAFDAHAGEITRIEWLSDRRGVAFGDRDSNILLLLSSDAGATWRRARFPPADLERIYASHHVGRSVWACGFSGGFYRSRDAGETFARTKRTPFDDNDRCMTLSFIDERAGWAGGMNGTLYRTSDAGDSWTRMAAPMASPATGATTLEGGAVRALRVTGVVRLSATDGWVTMREQDSDGKSWTFRTGDAGATWRADRPPPVVEARLEGGSTWGDGGAVFGRDGRLRFVFGAELVRETPLAARGQPGRQIIREREALENGHVSALTDHALVESFDGGLSWTTRTTEDKRRIVGAIHVDGKTLMALDDRTIMTAIGTSFRRSDQPEFDRFRMERVRAERNGLRPPPGPLSRLALAPSGRLDVRLDAFGCFHASQGNFRLTWSAREASLAPESDGSPPIALSPRERTRLLAEIAAAVERADDGRQGCTSHLRAELAWEVPGQVPGRVDFDESDCGGAREIGPAHRIRAMLQTLLVPGVDREDRGRTLGGHATSSAGSGVPLR